MASPLADRLRPRNLDDMVGQSHLIGPGKPLRRIVESGQVPNLIFYGPSGTGKTFRSSICLRLFVRLFAAEIIASRKVSPLNKSKHSLQALRLIP